MRPAPAAAFAVLLALLAPLTACQVDQDADMAIYRGVLDSRVAPAGGARETFDPASALPLKRALQLANQYNEALASTGEDYLQAIIEHKRTLATFLPTVDFGPQFAIADKVTSPPNPTLNAGFSTGYDNFNAWKQLAESAQTASTAEQKRELLLDAQTQLLQDVVRTYYAAALSEQRVRVFEGSLAVQEERVRDVAAQAQVGLARDLDYDQAKAQAASTRAQLEQAKGDAANTRAALALLVGVGLIRGDLTDGYTPPASIDALDSWLKTGVEHRSDLAAAIDAVHAARKGVDAKFAQYYPSISINFDYFVYRETVPTASLYTALFQANIPIFTGQRIHQEVRAEWSKFRQTKLDESLTRRRIEQAVRIAYQNVITSQARLIELKTQVTSAQDAFTQSVDLLRVGLATNLERLIAQDTLLKSQLDFITEELNYKVVVLELRRAGGLHPLGDLAPATQPVTSPASQPASTQKATGVPRAEAR